jgi:hypothetical protein
MDGPSKGASSLSEITEITESSESSESSETSVSSILSDSEEEPTTTASFLVLKKSSEAGTDESMETPEDIQAMISTLNTQLEELRMLPWYDPGMIMEYRDSASRLIRLYTKLQEIDRSSREIAPMKFLLNTFDIERIKDSVRVAMLGKDDWLETLYMHHRLDEEVDEEEDEEEDECSQKEEEEEESSELGGISHAIEEIRLHSQENDEELISEISPVGDGSVYPESEEEGCFGEDIYYWERMHSSFDEEEEGMCIPYFSVCANWPENMLECCITIGPFHSKGEAHRIETAYEIAGYLGQANTPTSSLARWSETIRRLVLVHQSQLERCTEMVEEEPEEKPAVLREDLLSSIMSSMEEVTEERKKAYIPVKALREKERHDLILSAGVIDGYYGRENSRGVLLDPMETLSCSVVHGYAEFISPPGVPDGRSTDIRGWAGPYRNPSFEEQEMGYYLQYRVKLCSLFSSCLESLPVPPASETTRVDEIQCSIWSDIRGQDRIGRTTCYGTVLSNYLTNYVYRIFPSLVEEDEFEGTENHEHEEERNFVHFQWEPIHFRYVSDAIPYQEGEMMFFNMLFSLAFTRYKTLASTMSQTGSPEHILMRQVQMDRLQSFRGSVKEGDTYICADQTARESILETRDVPLVLLRPDALKDLACVRGELESRDDENYMGFFSTLNTTLMALVRKHEEFDEMGQYVFLQSLFQCVQYFLNTATGQRRLRETLMQWKELLIRWLGKVTLEAKQTIDDLLDDDGMPRDENNTSEAIMDYVVVSTFVERLDSLLMELSGLPIQNS